MHTANARVRAMICRLASVGAEAARFGIAWMNLGDGSGQVPEDVEAPLDGNTAHDHEIHRERGQSRAVTGLPDGPRATSSGLAATCMR
jgi:hypothetical protein